jgi:hypothetical protein
MEVYAIGEGLLLVQYICYQRLIIHCDCLEAVDARFSPTTGVPIHDEYMEL